MTDLFQWAGVAVFAFFMALVARNVFVSGARLLGSLRIWACAIWIVRALPQGSWEQYTDIDRNVFNETTIRKALVYLCERRRIIARPSHRHPRYEALTDEEMKAVRNESFLNEASAHYFEFLPAPSTINSGRPRHHPDTHDEYTDDY